MGIMKKLGFSILEAIQLQPGSTRMEIFENCKTVFSFHGGWGDFKRMLSILIADDLVDRHVNPDPGLDTFCLTVEGISLVDPE